MKIFWGTLRHVQKFKILFSLFLYILFLTVYSFIPQPESSHVSVLSTTTSSHKEEPEVKPTTIITQAPDKAVGQTTSTRKTTPEPQPTATGTPTPTTQSVIGATAYIYIVNPTSPPSTTITPKQPQETHPTTTHTPTTIPTSTSIPTAIPTATATPTPTPQPLLSSFNGKYYSTNNFTGAIALERDDNEIKFDWARNAPHSSMPVDNFSVRWEGIINATAGTYVIITRHDDGMRIFINNVLVYNQWFGQSATVRTSTISLTEGTFPIKIEYFEGTGDASANVEIRKL